MANVVKKDFTDNHGHRMSYAELAQAHDALRLRYIALRAQFHRLQLSLNKATNRAEMLADKLWQEQIVIRADEHAEGPEYGWEHFPVVE